MASDNSDLSKMYCPAADEQNGCDGEDCIWFDRENKCCSLEQLRLEME